MASLSVPARKGRETARTSGGVVSVAELDSNLRLKDWIGKTVEVVVDRPLGSGHPIHADIIYEVNYGYIPGTLAPDGDELDVYVLGADGPLARCRARVVAIVRRRDDVEDKLVASMAGAWNKDAIAAMVHFQERFFDSWVELPASG